MEAENYQRFVSIIISLKTDFKIMLKRTFDILFSCIALLLVWWLLILLWILLCIDTNSNGFFIQERIGQYGKKFNIFKLKTFHPRTQKFRKSEYF